MNKVVYVLIAGVALFLLNYVYIQYSGSSNGSHSNVIDRHQLRNKIDKLRAESQLQAEREARLEKEIHDLEKIKKAVEAPALNKPVVEEVSKEVVTKDEPHQVPPASNKHLTADNDVVMPILLFACNRPPNEALDKIIEYRPSSEKFPIIVTQDCNDAASIVTSDAIDAYGDKILKHIKQPDQSAIPNLRTSKEKKFEPYFKISRHYKWAFTQIFDVMSYNSVIILEDDLIISPDFFDYFEAGYRLMKSDPSLFCVSAWNDNGKSARIEDNPERLWRSDFFPGLGWLLLKEVWDEIKSDWPLGFWDDWIRQEKQRKDKACVRPEISRVGMSAIGKKGASKGQFYEKHLKFIVRNTSPVKFSPDSLSYLHKDNYDTEFIHEVYSSPVVNIKDLQSLSESKQYKSVRIQYSTKTNFKQFAKTLQIMEDFKEGVPRTAYRGVVPITFNGLRVYLAPPSDWKGYDKTWT